MRKLYSTLLLLISLVGSVSAQSLIPSHGKARAGTYGFLFTQITVDARAASMGNSSVAIATDASSLFWNPALAVQVNKNEIMFGYTSYFVGVNQGYLGYVQQLGKTGLALGASLQYLDSGEMNETTEFHWNGTGRTFKTNHYSVGLTLSQRLTDLFSYGITAKYLEERFEEIKAQTTTVDFGFFYKVGETGLRFAVGVNNFGFDNEPNGSTTAQGIDTLKVHKDFESISPPTTFNVGAAYDAWHNENMNLIVTAQLSKPSDNAERLSIGAEYGFNNLVFFRTGYEFGKDEIIWPSAGLGVNTNWNGKSLSIDMSYTAYERLGNITRLAVKIGF